MSYQLIIAEKPSVAQAIAKVLGLSEKKDGYIKGNDYIVSWCIGHLVQLSDAATYNPDYAKWTLDTLPILPAKWHYEVSAGKQKQFAVLKKLMNHKDVTAVVNAADAGREGELIFRLVYTLVGCDKPMKRLWISSMEDAAIKDGIASLRDGCDYDNLHASALCRMQADWLVGINATRLYSLLYGATLNIGRVQSPTLSLLVQRQMQINSFEKEAYYHAHIESDNLKASSEKLDKETADQLASDCAGKTAIVTSLEQERKSITPPKLFDLTTLQREANRLFGYTAMQTLELTQSLYEKKLVTYPRTDSRYITADMAESAAQITVLSAELFPFLPVPDTTDTLPNIINDKKVTDHHAIIPTKQVAGKNSIRLSTAEENILSLIACRLLCAVGKPQVYETITAILTCEDSQFTAKGKTILEQGWMDIEERFKIQLLPDHQKKAATALPKLTEGQTFDLVNSSVTEHFTTPPKPYTEDTLLSAMEHASDPDIVLHKDAEKKGLGTPATRAAIIEKLIAGKFAERKKKQLLPTKKGINLISILPEELISPALTAEWENSLTEIANGTIKADSFMNQISTMVTELIGSASVQSDKKDLFRTPLPKIGTCPRCGESVVEAKSNFYCENRNCGFVMWKNAKFFTAKGTTLTKEIAAALLKSGKVLLKGLYSEKKDTNYDAYVLLDDTGDKYVNYKLEFPKRKQRKK